jgi:hypothetical protein
MGVCDVHSILDGDGSLREVKYCPVCDANLCDDCRGRYDLRAVAAIKRLGQRTLDALGVG